MFTVEDTHGKFLAGGFESIEMAVRMACVECLNNNIISAFIMSECCKPEIGVMVTENSIIISATEISDYVIDSYSITIDDLVIFSKLEKSEEQNVNSNN